MRTAPASFLLPLLVIGSLSFTSLSAQESCFTGRLFDAATGADLKGSIVVPERGTAWTVEGNFRICAYSPFDSKVMAASDDHLRQYYRNIDTCLTDCENSSHWLQATTVRVAPGVEPHLEFPLKRGGTAKGRVISRDTGAPVADAVVTVSMLNGMGYVDVAHVVTDSNGMYRFPSQLWGGDQYKILVQHSRYLPSISGDQDCVRCSVMDGGSTVVITRGNELQADFSLRERYGTISGQVIDRFTRAPIEGAWVAIQGSTSGTGQTDAAGRYVVEIERKPFRAQAGASRYATQVYSCLYSCMPDETPYLEIPPGNAGMTVNFELSSIDLQYVWPSWSAPLGGETARLYGSGLDEIVELRIAGKSVPFRSAHEAFVEFTIPAHSEGTVDLWVRDEEGRTYELPEGLTYWKGSTPRRIRDIEDFSQVDGRKPSDLLALGSTLYFPGERGKEGLELWKSDGTMEGTSMIKDIDPLPTQGVSPSGLTRFGNLVYFTAGATSLWRSDGTEPGTREVKSPSGQSFVSTTHLQEAGRHLYFVATDASNVTSIWATTEGSDVAQPILQLVSNGYYPYFDFVELGSHVFFGATGGKEGHELWITDGTSEGTKLLADVFPFSGHSVPLGFTPFNGKLYFAANTPMGRELVVTDGTTAGTKMVVDLEPSYDGSFPLNLIVFGGALYFEGYNTAKGYGIWKTDGTAGGTVFVASGWGPMAIHRGSLFFMDARGLVKTDGKTLTSVASIQEPEDLIVVNGRLWLSSLANGPCYDHCRSIWTSDGTTSGTYPLGNFNWKLDPVQLGQETCFVSEDARLDGGLWCSDGTLAGSRLVWDFYEDLQHYGSNPTIRIPESGRIYINAVTQARGVEWWRTDLTEQGTRPLTGEDAPVPTGDWATIVTAGNTDFFPGFSSEHGLELWATEGTAATTRQVIDLVPGTDSGFIGARHFAIGQDIYFQGPGPSYYEPSLWRSDGTADGTKKIFDSTPAHLVALGSDLLFAGSADHDCIVCLQNPLTGTRKDLSGSLGELSPGPEITQIDVIGGMAYIRTRSHGLYRASPSKPAVRLTDRYIDDLVQLGDRVFMVDVIDHYAYGRITATVLILEGDSIRIFHTFEGITSPIVSLFASARHVFIAVSNLDQINLWSIENEELRHIHKFYGPPYLGGIANMEDLAATPEGLVFFSGPHGYEWEIWQTDGTAERTRLAWDVSRNGSANPKRFSVSGPYLLFTAESPSGDQEPWMVQYKPSERKRGVKRR